MGVTMKTFEVELRRTSFITVTVEANTSEEAEEKAWAEIKAEDYRAFKDADWELESVEEKK